MDVHGIELEAQLGGAYFFVILFCNSVKLWVGGHCRDMSDFRPTRRLATQASKHSDVQLHPVHSGATLAMRPHATRPFLRALYCRSAVVAATARFQRSCSPPGFFQTLNVHNGGHSTVIPWWRLQQLLIRQPPELGRRPDLPASRVRLACEAWASTTNTVASRHLGIACHNKRRGEESCFSPSSSFLLFWGPARWHLVSNQFRGWRAKNNSAAAALSLNPRRRMFF
jgi:hypothetical protein